VIDVVTYLLLVMVLELNVPMVVHLAIQLVVYVVSYWMELLQ
jgi:hypothetical protein